CRTLHLAFDSSPHKTTWSTLSLINLRNSEPSPGLIRQPHRKFWAAPAAGPSVTRPDHDDLRRKKLSALIPPRKG
ncbi:IS5/IS1182 family transposase, partial [Enterobacter hormaechei]|nr:IS5/IS1182 family transposase [Enterobacter hormaechei]